MKLKFLAILLFVSAAHARTADKSADYCRDVWQAVHPSDLFKDLKGIAGLTEKGMSLDHAKFAMMKRVRLHSTENSTVIERDNGPAGKESVTYSKISSFPRVFEISDVNRMGSLTDFFSYTKIRVQFVDGVCVPVEVKQASGAKPQTWATLFELNDCLHDKAKTKNCRIHVAGLLEDPRAGKAVRQTQFTLLKSDAPGAAH